MDQPLSFTGIWSTRWTFKQSVGGALMTLQQGYDGSLTGTYDYRGGTISGQVVQVENDLGTFAIATGTWNQTSGNGSGSFRFVLDASNGEVFFGSWQEGLWWGLVTY